MDNNKKQSLLKRLRRIATETEAAIRDLEAEIKTGELPVCPYCKLEIQPGEKLRRRVHNRCYLAARSQVVSGETTWAKLEAAGLVGKTSAGGRPKRFVDKAEKEMEASVNQRRVKRKRSGDS